MNEYENELIKKIKSYDVVSFDVYDTLVKRCVVTPSDVFKIVAQKYNERTSDIISSETFKEDRILAGRKAKEHLEGGSEETSIEKIYKELPDTYNRIKNYLLNIELEVEANCCVSNPSLKRVYEWCKKAGKKIFIISDMYLPNKVIVEVLRKCGYEGYEKLYLSSDVLKRKRTGGLFQYFLADTEIGSHCVVHIGDDVRSDYFQARRNGIFSIKVKKTSSYCKYKRLCGSSDAEYVKLEKLIGNLSDPDWNPFFQYGFEVVGPALYGFTLWLHNKAIKENSEKLFFLSRDAYLMQKTYKMLYGNRAISNSYLYVSRKSMAPTELRSVKHLSKILELETSYRYWNVEELCEKLGVEVEIGRKAWIDSGLNAEDKFLKKELIANDKVKSFFKQIRPLMEEKANLKVQTILDYLNQENFHGNVMIVDVGWAGTIQKYLQSLIENHQIEANLYGCYFGLKDIALNVENIDSYIPKTENPPLFCSQLMEYPFTQLIGTTIGYKKRENGETVPVLAAYEYEGKSDAQSTKMIQDGMMCFVKVMKNGYGTYEPYDYSAFYNNLKNVTKNPRLCDVDLLGNLTHVNYGSTNYLAKPRSMMHYILHRHDLKYDMSTSGWKIGFMKKLMKMPLPYNAMLSAVRKK